MYPSPFTNLKRNIDTYLSGFQRPVTVVIDYLDIVSCLKCEGTNIYQF